MSEIYEYFIDVCDGNEALASQRRLICLNYLKEEFGLPDGDEKAAELFDEITGQIRKMTKEYPDTIDLKRYMSLFTRIVSERILENERQQREKNLKEIVIRDFLRSHASFSPSVIANIVDEVFIERKKRLGGVEDYASIEEILLEVKGAINRRERRGEMDMAKAFRNRKFRDAISDRVDLSRRRRRMEMPKN